MGTRLLYETENQRRLIDDMKEYEGLRPSQVYREGLRLFADRYGWEYGELSSAFEKTGTRGGAGKQDKE
jgi:hypothetical protein